MAEKSNSPSPDDREAPQQRTLRAASDARPDAAPPPESGRRSEIAPEPRTTLVLHLGREELVIRKRYEALSIANDILIGLWFLVGSFLFFSEATTYAATWLFVIGSVEMLIRPVIRFARHLHLQRFYPERESAVAADNDF